MIKIGFTDVIARSKIKTGV